MNADDLRSLLGEVGLSQVDFAHLIDVTPRAVNLWATGQREIPGPAASYLRLLNSLPENMRMLELSRLKEGHEMAPEGMYGVAFAGIAGTGQGVLVVNNGVAYGYDVGGGKYDGTYTSSKSPGYFDLRLRVTVPPGTSLVQGAPIQPMEYAFDINCSLKARAETIVDVLTPVAPTPVRAHIQFLRDVPN
ncbi:hypothetical protein UCD39_20130 [Nitrospirillum sp. BR 11752]|uniref:helix-turn-helix domain-containing protein n=1 Tax=Nitrospirillum sp. BR 11752 TaxID=3104293 RepID=UPI002EA1038D|nr:hypothetical protein [Nitrospirillum sp. BR 11752]